MKKHTSAISPQKESHGDVRAPIIYSSLKERGQHQELVGDSLWLSKKMIDDGCSLGQTLQMMEERCKGCNVISPMFCVEECGTWKVKKELRETNRVLSLDKQKQKLLNAIKNKRRLAILDVLKEGSLKLHNLRAKLKTHGFYHSRKVLRSYLKPLLNAGLINEKDQCLWLTLYGRKIHDAATRHCFTGELPINSEGYEERILRSLLTSEKTRSDLLKIAPKKSLARSLKRLRQRSLIRHVSNSGHVFYFRTRRDLSLEQLSPTEKKICMTIPKTGITAPALSNIVGISLRRTYKYLRRLRGKKLMFKREVPLNYELTARGTMVAEFLEVINGVEVGSTELHAHTPINVQRN